MNLRRHSPCILALSLLGIAFSSLAQAAVFTGTFTADNSVFSDPFTVSSPTIYTFATTSYASGGIVPVLSLFNTTTGAIVDYSGVNTGVSDVSIMDTLTAGSYVLDLTEFPNEAIGNLADGFTDSFYSDAATITGDTCGVSGGMFYNAITCTKTTANYALNVTSTTAPVAVTPEPASLLLLLPPIAFVMLYGRRIGLISALPRS